MREFISSDERLAIIQAYRNGEKVTAIATRYGVTRQRIDQIRAASGCTARKLGVKRRCAQCRKCVYKQRSRADRTARSFCSQRCYMRFIARPEYEQNRQGQRQARALVRSWFLLRDEHVVHHVDGDNTNNGLSNLMVFASQGDHMRWHRLGGEASGIEPLWRGDASGITPFRR